MSLFEITGRYRELLEQIEENPDFPAEAIADTLEAVDGEWEERANAVVFAIKNNVAFIAEMKEHISAMQERMKVKENAVKRLKEYLSNSMIAVGRDKFETVDHKVTFRKSESITIDDEAELLKFAKRKSTPEEVRERLKLAITTEKVVKIAKDEIKRMLKADVPVSGCTLHENKNIQIK